MKRPLRALLLALSLVPLDHAGAEPWPTRPIKIIISQAAGGTPDIICRIIGERLSQALGQPIVVENRPGGGNVAGAQAAARSVPDGYTLFFATAAALVSNPYTFKSLPYDPLADFVAVSMIAKGPFVVLVHPSVPARTLAELFAYEKANPGKLSFATDGPHNFSGMLAAWLNKLGGVDILQVPYAAMPQGIQDAVAGRVQLVILAIPSAAPHVASGALRPLAVSSLDRFPRLTDVPPIAETFPGVEFIGWFVLAAPKGTPADVVAHVNREMDVILKKAEVATRLADLGFFTGGADSPDGTAKYIRSQYEFWRKLTRDIGLQPE
jgi:tripartite-type tricarboxylate transporter receptor subunit TctC